MEDYLIRPVAQRIYEERLYLGADGSTDNDWELAVEYLRNWQIFQVKDYLEFIWCNTITDHEVAPRIPQRQEGMELSWPGDDDRDVPEPPETREP